MENEIKTTDYVLNMNSFIELFLATLAERTKFVDYERPYLVIVAIPISYKKVIETIMYEESSCFAKYSKLMDIEKYYKNQSDWEMEFTTTLDSFLTQKEKHTRYNFENDFICIGFIEDEIQEILEKYDENTIETMRIFANQFQEYGVNAYLNSKEDKAISEAYDSYKRVKEFMNSQSNTQE